MWGDCPAASGLVECRRAHAAAEHLTGRAMTAACLGYFAAVLGRADEAGQARDLAEQLANELGPSVGTTVNFLRGFAELDVENWSEAERLLEGVFRDAEAVGDKGHRSTYAAMQAHALLHIGRVDDARSQAALAVRLGSAEDLVTHALASGALGWIAALDGERVVALRHMDRATTLLPLEALPDRATVHVACAEAATVLDDAARARRHRLTAIDLCTAKGNVVRAALQRSLL
jgi:hypothetical protein